MNKLSMSNLFANFFGKFMVFMFGWWVLATILTWYSQPKPKPVKDLFYICTLENNNPSTPTMTNLNDYQASTSKPDLCTKPYKQEFSAYYFLEFTQVKPSKEVASQFNQINHNLPEWELKTWTDSMADPFIYHYQVDENNKIYPLWYTYGGWANSFISWFYALIAMTVIWTVGRKVYDKKSINQVNKDEQLNV